jgi:hypothetical protein
MWYHPPLFLQNALLPLCSTSRRAALTKVSFVLGGGALLPVCFVAGVLEWTRDFSVHQRKKATRVAFLESSR